MGPWDLLSIIASWLFRSLGQPCSTLCALPGLGLTPRPHQQGAQPGYLDTTISAMSGRAVRKALRQRELAALSQKSKPDSAVSDEESEEEVPPQQKQSLFALLGGEDEDGDAEKSDEDEEKEEALKDPVAQKQEPTSTSSKKKKKKKKGKGKTAPSAQQEGEDEIDAALRVLNLQQRSTSAPEGRAEETKQLSEILCIDPRNLDATNEMRRLFGRAAIGGTDDPRGAGGRRRPAAAGRGLTGRKNAFVQAKEEWPVSGSGGLGMETVATSTESVTEFRFVHSTGYQDVQRQFMMCVASMGTPSPKSVITGLILTTIPDPNRLIQLMQHNPYHVSTLLQASEIFAQQRDHTISGDLLERALFTFGRSLHSSFQSKMEEGRARLSFLRPENREFWLCCWRYLRNLQMRGTWRTAEEFTRLLLAMDPEGDPYQMRLCIDFMALKARQPEHLLALVEHPALREQYSRLPNIAYSTALAYKQLGQDAAAREHLAKAMTKFPWVVSRLYAELNVDVDVPPALWGVLPPEGDMLQPILSDLYASRTKDLWKEPEATRMLIDVANTIYNLPKTLLLKPPSEKESANQEIIEGVSLDVARHVLVTDIPTVIALLPRAFTRRESPGYDPLPPVGDVRSYSIDIPDTAPGAIAGEGESGVRASLLREFLMSLFPHMDRVGGAEPTEEDVRRLLRERGIDVEPGDLGFGVEEDGGGAEGR